MLETPSFDGNLHVFSQGCDEIGRMVRFRDWPRQNGEDRERYERTKRDLTSRRWDYADAKSAVIRAILEKATVQLNRK
jgi:GrpB-like predicted nucleotidyltransferase (UPF0157 family)